MRELRPYLTRDAFGGYKRIICRLRSVINAGRQNRRFIFSVKKLHQTIDIISNTDIIEISNKKSNSEVKAMLYNITFKPHKRTSLLVHEIPDCIVEANNKASAKELGQAIVRDFYFEKYGNAADSHEYMTKQNDKF